MKHHLYFHCDKGYQTGEELRAHIMRFFDHISGDVADAGFTPAEWQKRPEWRQQVLELRRFCEPLMTAAKLNNLTAGMFTSRIETFYSTLLTKAPKSKLFLATMQARMWAAILEWNESHISEVFLQTNEPDGERRDTKRNEPRGKEANWRRGWFERAWRRLLKAATPEFPDLDSEE